MSDMRTPISNYPQDQQDGLNLSNVMPRSVTGIPASQDYVKDAATVLAAETEIWPLLTQARSDRQSIESGWQEIRRMYLMQHDQNQKYKGRSNAYLPIHSKNAQTQLSQLARGLFPSDEYLDAQSESGQIEEAVRAKHYMQYQFERVANLRMYLKGFSAQLLAYGFSVLKFWYRKPAQYAVAKRAKMNLADVSNNAYGGSEYGAQFRKPGLEGLTVSARNIFNFYAYPYTAESLRETTIHFEDIKLTMLELKHLGKIYGWDEETMVSAPSPAEVNSDDAQRMTDEKMANYTTQNQGTPQGDVRVLTEVYTFLELPKQAYTDQDAVGCPLPVRIIFVGSKVVSIRRNTDYHQSSPFLGLSLNAHPGFFYGFGPGKMIQPLQYLANDFINQTNDVCIYGLNPIIKVQAGMVVGGLRPVAPGVTWMVNDMNAVEFMHPPTEQVGVGQSMAQMMVSMGQDFGGAPPIMQGTNAKGSGKTATGAQLLQQNASTPMQDLVEDIQSEVLVPLASRGWKLAQQFAPKELVATVFGTSLKMNENDFVNDMEWRWLASGQAANAQMRAFQTIQFLQAIQPWVPVLQQQGFAVNVIPVLRRIYSEALGYRGFDELIQKIMMAPGMAPGQPGQPPGAQIPMPGDPGDGAPRSTTEQAPGGGGPMQPGEGDAFGAVRQQSDLISQLMGAAGGAGPSEGE